MAHNEQQRLRTFHLFAGAGGGILADLLLGHVPIGACEIEDYPRAVLLQRQRDGILPDFPVWDDIKTLDGKPWRGLIDVVAGGFPCQDLSIAGKGKGLAGERSGLWGEMARIIGEIRPRYVFVENSPMLIIRGIERIVGDLAEMGYGARWGTMGGFTAGGCANGERLWLLANATDCDRWIPPPIQIKISCQEESSRREFERAISACASGSSHAACLGNPDGMARDVDRLKAAGNGQRPNLAAIAWEVLTS